jgi:general L-amino acid transport system substrate-binding protein
MVAEFWRERRGDVMDLFRKVAEIALACLAVWLILLFSGRVEAGDTLTRIKTRGNLRCGVSEGIQGFSVQDPDGRWSGMDVDFCRALAAAVLGDPGKVTFQSLTAPARFGCLKAGEVDVLSRNTTWTLEREAVLGVLFAGILYYDRQGFLVPKSSGVHELSQLNGATICVMKGSTHEGHLAQKFGVENWSYQPLQMETQAKAAEALYEGRCQSYTSEKFQLMALKMRAPEGPDQFVILPEEIFQEPLGPVVLRGDDDWFTIVRWVLFTLLQAEMQGYTQVNVRSRIENPDDFTSKSWKELDGLIAKSLTIGPGWGVRVVEAAGNYGEIYERNLGEHSPLKLDRGSNRLWKDGGLMYAPPFR